MLASAVCLLARTPSRTHSAHGHMQQRAYMRALADVYMRNVAYEHSTSLTRSRSDTLVRIRAHAHTYYTVADIHTLHRTKKHTKYFRVKLQPFLKFVWEVEEEEE